MNKIKSIQVALFLFGMIAVGIGLSVLFFPVQFEASAGIVLESNNSSLLSEMRAFGGLIFVGGIVISLGVFQQRFIRLSATTAAVFYLTIAFSRLVGMALDTMPSETIILVTVMEIAIGVSSVIILQKSRSLKTAQSGIVAV